MAPGVWQLLLVVLLVVLLFGGRGKISSIMGDMAKGIRSFRSGLKEGDAEAEDAAMKTLKEDGTVEVKPEAAKADAKG